MKDELGGKIMTEFLALREKMYTYRKIDKEVEEKCCKCTKKCVVSEGLTFDDYKTCLFDGETTESKCCLRTRNTRYGQQASDSPEQRRWQEACAG